MPNEQINYATEQRSTIRNVRRSTYERQKPRSSSSNRVRNRNLPRITKKTSVEGEEDKNTPSDGLFDNIRKWRVFGLAVSFTSIIYSIQIFFATVTFIGIVALAGTEAEWFIKAVDFVSFGSVTNLGAMLFWLGAAGAFLCGLISYAIALPLYKTAGIDGFAGINPLILALCLTGLLCPILNFLPLVWLWCLYMTLSSK